MCKLSFKWHLGNLFSLYGGCNIKVTVQGYFGGFWELKNIWAFMDIRKLQNQPKITLLGNLSWKAPKKPQKVPKVPFKDNGTAISSFKMHIIEKMSCCSTRIEGSSTLGFVIWLKIAGTYPCHPLGRSVCLSQGCDTFWLHRVYPSRKRFEPNQSQVRWNTYYTSFLSV